MDHGSVYYSANPIRSGAHNQDHTTDLLVFDLRMLSQDTARTSVVAALSGGTGLSGGDGTKRASGLFSAPGGGAAMGVAQRWKANSARKSASDLSQVMNLASGVIDMCLVEDTDAGEVMAMCVQDSVVKGYTMQANATLSESFTFDGAPFDDPGAKPEAIGCSGRFLFLASSAPSLSVYERTNKNEAFGHEEFKPSQPKPPLMLAAQYTKPRKEPETVELSKTVSCIEDHLRKDRARTPLEMAGTWTMNSRPGTGKYICVDAFASTSKSAP
jgi:hypothetical protein